MQHAEYRSLPRVNYGDVGWFSYLTFGWVNPLVETGVRRQVTLEDTPDLAEREDALVNTRSLLENLDESERTRKSHPLLRALAYTFWPQFLVLQFLRFAAHFLGLLDPILMAKVLVFQERQNAGKAITAEEARSGFQSVSALIMLGCFMIFFNSQMMFYQYRLQVRIGSALRGAVLFRCIEGQRGIGRTTGPSAYNVLSFDIDPIVDVIWIILAVWLFPIQFISTLVVLFQHVGWAIVPGLITIMVAKLICGILLYQDGVLRHRLLEAKDRRLRNCNEGFTHIRTLHMLAWRGPYERQIMEARIHELHAQKMRLWMMKMAAALDYSLSMIVTFATLGYYVHHSGEQLKASVALPVIQLIVNLMGPIGQIPTWINQYMVWKSAYARLSAFIGLDNHPEPLPDDASNDDFQSPSPDAQTACKSGVAACIDCCFSWGAPAPVVKTTLEEGQPLLEQTVFELRNLHLGVRSGELLVITGLEGQGKSSVLLGLLGEMTVKSGAAHSPALKRHSAVSRGAASLPGLPSSIKASRSAKSPFSDDCRSLSRSVDMFGAPCLSPGRVQSKDFQGDARVNPLAVPFSEQNAMLFTGTIRMNILFGAPHKSGLYVRVLRACALEDDLASMPAGDMTEVAQAGATLSGGQRRRISIARAVYRAALALQQQPDLTPLVLLDDPLCSLDKEVAKQVSDGLFGANGLLAGCAVVIATADPWWVSRMQTSSSTDSSLRIALLRGGSIVTLGTPAEVRRQGFSELDALNGGDDERSQTETAPPQVNMQSANPQGDDDFSVPEENNQHDSASSQRAILGQDRSDTTKLADSETQTELTAAQKEALHVVKEEDRDEGQVAWSTYKAYGEAVGPWKLTICAIALAGIMVFQNFCNLWIVYWTAEDKSTSFVYTSLQVLHIEPPTHPHVLLEVFGLLVLCFTICNFSGHAMEIIGGMAAAKSLFKQALEGAFHRPFRWWDANPTGRVLNRFSEDVMVMDQAITNIMGVIFGAVLYFVGHSVILAISNPVSLLLLPFIAVGLEYYAKYYRMTIREVHRIFRVRMGLLYQDMLEAIMGRVTVRSFARENQVMESSIDNLDRWQQISFCKLYLALWLGLRMALIGYTLSFWVKLRPILQYYGYVGEQSAALVGFSMTYSTETVNIIQQFITNYSDLEMQLISIERLAAYDAEVERRRAAEGLGDLQGRGGLHLKDVTVTYRVGLLPALVGVTIGFGAGEVAAIVGRTGAGKSSLLLSILQLVPHDGTIVVNGEALETLEPEDVRRRLVGVVPQQPVLFEGSLRWNLDPDEFRSDAELWAALAAVGLESKCRGAGGLSAKMVVGNADANSPDDTEEKVQLSTGQQQMLCAARVLLRQPKVAMLDEVSASLPAEAASSMVSNLVGRFKEHQTTVLLVTHQEKLIECCDRLVRIAGGRVVGDSRL